jgi:hypothetical protein
MREFARKVAAAVAPVFGVSIAISVLHGAELPFPPALELQAWAQWAVFASVVWTSTSLCMYTADRLFRAPRAAPGPAASASQ